jgi:WhiB family transcriptional regulator, redox-sensing transcriptional regulator
MTTPRMAKPRAITRMHDPNDQWKQDGLCRDRNPDLWFMEEQRNGCNKEAVTVCRACPVMRECLQHALDTEERFGVWGVTTPYQRDAMFKARRRQRKASA